jgi:arylsulfatase A-like enzyme
MERTNFVLRAVTDYVLPVGRPDLLTLWLTEPDHTQHSDGLCARTALSMLRELDRGLGDLVAALDRLGEHTYLLLSDHGFSTIRKRVTPDRALVEAGLKDSLGSTDVIRDGNSIYLNGDARARLGDIVRTLADQPWIGGLFVRDDHLDACPGAMPQTEVFGYHRRSADLLYAYQWSDAPNEHGVPGSVVSSSGNAATHGSASPYDIHNCLVAWGKGVARGIISAVPCGIVDVAPTALHLLGIQPPDAMQGRVLHELLEGGPLPETVTVRRETRDWDLPASSGTRRQVARYSIVDGHRYLDQVSI